MFKERNPLLDKMLVATASMNADEARSAMGEFTQALELPLRKGVMSGPIVGDIFEMQDFSNVRHVEYPLDFLAPGTEGDYTAYVIPNCGYIPQNTVQGDYVVVPTYMVGNSIDWCLKYAEDANWNIVDRALGVFRDGFVKKMNNDGAHALLAAGLDRNAVVYDSAASSGQFTKRLVSLMKVFMRRNSGGNSTSAGKGRMTDLVISPEAEEDIRNWNVDQVDELTRREIFVSAEGLTSIFQVRLRSWEEFGANQEYQLYYEDVLGGTMPASKVELVMGLDLGSNDSFVMPVRKQLRVFDDPTLHRQLKAGVYGFMEMGTAVLDVRRVLLGAI